MYIIFKGLSFISNSVIIHLLEVLCLIQFFIIEFRLILFQTPQRHVSW